MKKYFFLIITLVSVLQGWGQTSYTFNTASGTGAWSTSRWNNTADAAPYTSAFTSGNAVSFPTGAYSFVTGIGTGTIIIGNVTLGNNVTVDISGTVAGTYSTGGAVRTIDVGTGSQYNLFTQAISSAAGTGFIKNGPGAFGLAGSTYTGGFTLNAGTAISRGVNSFGAGGTLTLNGGTVAAGGTRDFTGKFTGGITIGGNIQFGEITANVLNTGSFAMTFGDAVSLGAANRTFTVGNTSLHTFNGIISGNSGVGLNFASNGNSSTTGGFTLGGANTFSGTTSVSGVPLNITHISALGATSSGTTINSGASLRLAVATSANYDAEPLTINGAGIGTSVGAIRTTTNTAHTLSGAITLGSNASIQSASGSLTITGGISGAFDLTLGGSQALTVSTNPISQVTGLIKDGAGTLTLTAQNTYTGLTTVSAGTLKLNRTGGSTIPSTNNITVGSGATLQISSNQTINNLDLSAGGNLIVDAGVVLTIAGNYIPGSGTINCNLTGRINLTSNSPQSFPGTLTTTTNLGVLGIGNTTGATPSVTIDKAITLNTSLNLTSGTLTTAGLITLANNATIFRTGGTITDASPIFGTTVNLSYNNSVGLTTGFEVPTTASTLNNLTVSGQTVTLGSSITINGNLTLTAGVLALGSNTLTYAGSSITRTSGSIDASDANSTLIFTNTSSLSLPANTFSGNVNNFTLNGAGGVTLGSATAIARTLTLTSGTLTTSDFLTLASDNSTTSRVAEITGGGITGNVTVQRFLPKRRAWRFLTAPVTQNTPQSLNATWQTQIDIVGPSGTNLSAIKNGYSFLTYNATTDAWTNVNNPAAVNLTGTSLNNAFAAFIPGPSGTAFGDSADVT
ncbi:MAG: beta strand repeat-containing protein, partial [Dolichospermum sp.]